MPEPSLDAATLRAFHETHYAVDGDPPFALRIGERSDALAALHAVRGVACSAYVTACNPRCVDLGAAANAPRMAALRDELRAGGWQWLEGHGRHPTNGWPPEPSLLVLGLPLAAARDLAARHGQDAFVACGADATPRLERLR